MQISLVSFLGIYELRNSSEVYICHTIIAFVIHGKGDENCKHQPWRNHLG